MLKINQINFYLIDFHLEVCSLPTFDNGRLTTNTLGLYKSGDQVQIICDPPFAPAVQTTTCQRDRTWDPQPSCTEVTCTVPALENGYYSSNQQRIASGSLVAYPSPIVPHCVVGYTPTPNTSRICQNNQQWSDRPPTCVTITCNTLPPPFANGTYTTGVKIAPYSYNHEIIPTCNTGYYHQNGDTRKCTDVDFWSGQSPVCLQITCKSPNNFTHGFYNSSQPVYQFGSALLAACDMGYKLTSTNNLRVCVQNNHWNGDEPVCEIVQCMPPSSIENGTLNPNSSTFEYRKTITLKCNDGYEAENGRTTMTCLHDGTWDLTSLKCNPVRCNDTNDVQHDVVQGYPPVAFGQVGEVTYNSTFFNLKNGSLQVQCSSERKLSWIIKPEFGEQVKNSFIYILNSF